VPFLVFFTHVFSCLLSWCLVTWLFFTFPHVFLLFFPMFFSFSCVSCMQSHTTWVNNATRLLMHYLWSNAISLFCVLKKIFFSNCHLCFSFICSFSCLAMLFDKYCGNKIVVLCGLKKMKSFFNPWNFQAIDHAFFVVSILDGRKGVLQMFNSLNHASSRKW
jgi:hypothetical protein